ncbi:cupin domain-containing protein [Phytohabitans flavus]|uniref:Cupin n=1 Tax=Phytohabitans flavus TaxID=1076124 RepID=A0A6F8XU61_9ACTN|nr:cupin domain-containing protein [Phytohabitans flavus]BCB77278.1 cupin [Phytohabitans flavus]
MDIAKKGSTEKGPAIMFTGEVWMDVMDAGEGPPRIGLNSVHFAPGARTAWHRHADGQTLHVTDGVGRIGVRSGEQVEIRNGDTIHAAPGEWHWHGAAPDQFMTHLAVTKPAGDGSDIEWGAHVTDEEYGGR